MQTPQLETIAFRMNLDPGQADEYKRRHDEIWPELSVMLRAAGASDYSIWLDEETNHLFAILKRPDNTPVQVGLVKMFQMP